jgi:ribosome-associated protein
LLNSKETLQSKVQASLVVTGARDGKASQIALYDLREKSSLADYVVICEGRSQTHCRGIAEKIQEKLKIPKIRPLGVEGEMEGTWILLDYGEVIAHIFHPDIRSYYKLDELQPGPPSETWDEE